MAQPTFTSGLATPYYAVRLVLVSTLLLIVSLQLTYIVWCTAYVLYFSWKKFTL